MISLSNKSHHWCSSQMRMPFDSNHSAPLTMPLWVTGEGLPGTWKNISCSSVRYCDACVAECQNETPRLICTWHTHLIQKRMKVSWTPRCCFISSAMTCHPCRHLLSVSRGHLAPYCLWTQNKKSRAEWLWAQTPHQMAKSQAHFLPVVGFLVTIYVFVSASVKWRLIIYIPGELADGNL